MFFNGWSGIIRLIAVGIPAYIALVLLLRISGKRTLSKFNAVDLVVTFTFGSMLASAFLAPALSLTTVVAGFTMLVLLQFVTTWTSARSRFVHTLVKARPQLLYHRGQFLRDPMKGERIGDDEILAAIRSEGLGALEAVDSVILETDGSLSVVSSGNRGSDAMKDVRGHPA
ncbi:MAG TPA: YetF domain-containing protein [Longimicrobiales bacterium]|nr:YetF domain-containing protein [Longimicrobiales bacterium]